MPRPSLKDLRSRQILEAFVTCAARHGLEGATQERIAEEAGVKRTLLRHYLGNRAQMILALSAHVAAEFEAQNADLEASLSSSTKTSELLDLLFDRKHATDPRLVLVFQALTASSTLQPAMRAPLLVSMEGFLAVLARHLRRLSPYASEEDYDAAAHGLAALFTTADALAPLSPPSHWRLAQRRAAEALIETLKRRPS